MPLTPEARAEINRKNAAKSTGPKTEEGKNASRRNALKHGLRAEVVAMPTEDPAAVQARADAWNDYYRPQSPAAQHLVNQCVAATLLADRVNAYHDAAVAKRMRDAAPGYDDTQRDGVSRLARLFRSDPAVAVRGLMRTAAGCRELVARWEELERALDEWGSWTSAVRDEAIRLQGLNPQGVPIAPGAWLTMLLNMLSRDTYSAEAVAAMFDPRVWPAAYREAYRPDRLPDPEHCREGMRLLVTGHLEMLRAREADLRAAHEGPDRAGVTARALVPAGRAASASARLFLRYHSEARNAFHRAYAELVKTLTRDAGAETEAACEPEITPAEEAKPAVREAEEDSPDEAIHEREEVERPGAENLSREPRHIPLAAGVGRSGPSQTTHAAALSGLSNPRHTSPGPEDEGENPQGPVKHSEPMPT